MRLIAKVPSHPEYKRLMIYESEDGIYLFYYDTEEDTGSRYDDWIEPGNLGSLLDELHVEFGISQEDWQQILDPCPGCLPDFIEPVRVERRDRRSPQYEKLVNGEWVDYSP